MNTGQMSAGFFFIRHGETTANRAGVHSGSECDPPLTARGREQAAAAGRALAALNAPPRLIVSSALSRAHETARIINAALGLEIRIEPALNERLLGEWNGRPVAQMQPRLSAGETPPGGEPGEVFRARVLAAFHALAPFYAQWPLVVASRGIARIMLECAGQKGVTGLPNGVLVRVALADAEAFRIAAVDYPAMGGAGDKAKDKANAPEPGRS